MNEPLISVVIPTRNRAKQVKQAVLSVLAQTEKDLEVIVVDDGSTDGTQAALQEIQDARLRYVRQEHTGACAARNKGVSLAHGKYGKERLFRHPMFFFNGGESGGKGA